MYISDTWWWGLQVLAVFPCFIIQSGIRLINSSAGSFDDEISGDRRFKNCCNSLFVVCIRRTGCSMFMCFFFSTSSFYRFGCHERCKVLFPAISIAIGCWCQISVFFFVVVRSLLPLFFFSRMWSMSMECVVS